MSYESLRYNEVRQKSVHNAFQRDEGIHDQLLYWRVRSLEADVHITHPLAGPPRDGPRDDWCVYHSTFDLYSSVHTLAGLLRTCAAFHRAMPYHEVVTLFLDIKSGFPRSAGASRSRRRFDELLEHHLGGILYRPADLLARDPAASTLREVVQGVGWPTLAELRGRFVVVLTGSEIQIGNYVGAGERAVERIAFLSGNVRTTSDIGGDDDLVFFNMHRDHVALAAAVTEQQFVSRAYYIDDLSAWDEAELANCNHVATDMVNARTDPWSSTSGPTGFPFEALHDPTPRVTEVGTVGGIWARSGDIWERNDSFVFHHRRCPTDDLDHDYVFTISGPNSHTEPWTKGGIMARESADPGARYFGVFRPGQGSGLRVQFRSETNRSTTVLECHIGPHWSFGSHFEQDTLVFARLVVDRHGRRMRGFGSIDGDEWLLLGEVEFDAPLALHGLAVSAHGQRRGAKYLFVVPGDGPRPPFDTDLEIGTSTDPARGWVDWDGTRRWRTTRFSR